MSTETKELTKPVVGMGATLIYPNDRYPYTIIEVNANGKKIKVSMDDYKRTDNNGMSESQTYEYTTTTDGIIREFSLRKNGYYYQVGEPMSGAFLSIGVRRAYYCFSY